MTIEAHRQRAWEQAQHLWGARVHEPIDASGGGARSFAWFSFPPRVSVDHDLVDAIGASGFLDAIYAHEIGHHVLSPSTRLDAARIDHQMGRALLAYGAPNARVAQQAQLLGNLWSDMLINTRIERTQRRRNPAEEPTIIGLWRHLSPPPHSTSPLWWVLMRSYELQWRLPSGTLCTVHPPQPSTDPPRRKRRTRGPKQSPATRTAPTTRAAPTRRAAPTGRDAGGPAADGAPDAAITPERLDPVGDALWLVETIAHFAADPVTGAIPFGMMLAPYLIAETPPDDDTTAGSTAGRGGCGGRTGSIALDGPQLAEVLGDPRLSAPLRHPGLIDRPGGTADDPDATIGQLLQPAETLLLLDGHNPDDVLAAWYVAAARPHVVHLRERPLAAGAVDETVGPPQLWEIGDDADRIDWADTVRASPRVIPGVTTRRRDPLESVDPPPDHPVTVDLYLDSSASMPHPSAGSPAVLAATIIIGSVIAGGGRIRVTSWSGAGEVAGDAAFTRSRVAAVADALTYFGGGTAFPLDLYRQRYQRARAEDGVRRHVVVLSDDGLVSMFGAAQPGRARIAATIRPVLTTATLLVIDPLRRVSEAAAAAGYTIEYLETLADAPAACARLARTIASEAHP